MIIILRQEKHINSLEIEIKELKRKLNIALENNKGLGGYIKLIKNGKR